MVTFKQIVMTLPKHLTKSLKKYYFKNLTKWCRQQNKELDIEDFLTSHINGITGKHQIWTNNCHIRSTAGTVLGPILFLVYINDLNDYIKHGTLRLFADDSIIYKTIKNKHDSEKLQDLTAAAKWEEDWLMSFHSDKSSVLQVTTKKTPLQYDYILHGHTLQ